MYSRVMTMTEIHPIGTTNSHVGQAGVITLSNGVILSQKQRRMLDLALKFAESSDGVKRHGAVIVRGGRVLSVGVNKWRNRYLPASVDYDPNLTVHAEIDALSRLENPRGATIYIARVNNQGKAMMSRPCIRCEAELQRLGVKKVVYTVS